MAQVSLTINGRQYEVTCDDGQEDHLVELAALVEARVRDLVASVGQIGEARLLMMASLLIADELKAARNGAGRPAEEAEEAATALVLERCAERLEAIAAHLEGD